MHSFLWSTFYLHGQPSISVCGFSFQGKNGSRLTAAVAVERPTKEFTVIEVSISWTLWTSWRHVGLLHRRVTTFEWINVFKLIILSADFVVHCLFARPTCVHEQPPGGERTAPLYVHRITNGVPMLDTNSSSTCALVAGVSGAGWRNLGLKILASRISQLEGRVRFILSEAPTPLKVVLGIKKPVFRTEMFSLPWIIGSMKYSDLPSPILCVDSILIPYSIQNIWCCNIDVL